MKRIIIPFLICCCITAFPQCNQLVWSDEFNGNAIDLTKWNFQTGDGCPALCGWGNGELENYTTSNKNASVANGLLTLTAVKETQGNSQFTSSKLVTLGLHAWKYGRFEARMRMPLGNGLWPAFWMLSTNNQWPMTGEIDIMEYRGDIPKQTNGTLHYGNPWPENRYDYTSYDHTNNLSDEFHVYSVEWDENQIKWFFNDILFKTETRNPNSLSPPSNNANAWPWNTDFYIILNLAVGGGYAGSPSPDQVALTKPTFEIDYVRVYSGAGSSASIPVINGPSRIFTGGNETYSVENISGANYNWTLSGNSASIISGQGTNTVVIKNTKDTPTTLAVNVSNTSAAPCEINAHARLPIASFTDYCDFTFNNFETSLVAAPFTSSDGIASAILNPAISSFNPSSNVLKYVRSENLYDVIFLDSALIRNGSDFENGSFVFEMDIFSTAPVGTPVEIQIGSTGAWNQMWPIGRHTVYRALTTKTNQWETLRFALSQAGDPNRYAFDTNVDRLIVLLNPNAAESDTFYIDNLKRTSISSTSCTITDLEDQKTEVSKVKLYPTISESIFNIETTQSLEKLSVYNMWGSLVLQDVSINQMPFSFGQNLSAGNYLVVLNLAKGQVVKFKILKH